MLNETNLRYIHKIVFSFNSVMMHPYGTVRIMIDFKFFDIYVINAIVTLVYFSSSYGYNRVLSLSIDLVRIQSSLSKDFSKKKCFKWPNLDSIPIFPIKFFMIDVYPRNLLLNV